MSRTINPIQKALLKKNLLEHPERSIEKNMIAAGYKATTASKSGGNKCVKVSQAEILEDIKKQITVESVLKSLEKIKSLAIAAEDFSTATRCDELCGRWLAMWRDRLELVPIESVDAQFSVGRLARMRSIPVVGVDITANPTD